MASTKTDEKQSSEGHGDKEKESLKLVDSAAEDNVDFGGEKSLPPPPQLTEEEEKKLYRKIDLRCVHFEMLCRDLIHLLHITD
jgi:hypothetical protein